jgi:hypothetical protein
MDEFEGRAIDLEKIKPDVKQAIIWTREAWNMGVQPKTISNRWRKTGILPPADVQIVEQPGSSSDLIAELATLLTEFARDAIPDVMEAQELLEVDCEVPTEAEVEDLEGETADVSSEEEEVQETAPRPVTLREARACMARVAEFMQVNGESRGLARFVDVSIEMQSELDKTVTTASHHQAPVTQFFKPAPKITTISST